MLECLEALVFAGLFISGVILGSFYVNSFLSTVYLIKFVIVVSHSMYCLFVCVYNMVLIVSPMTEYVLFFITITDGHHAS